MRNVTDRISNPFGMSPPTYDHDDGREPSVPGYGDANADFHLIGDHPGAHGGERTGVPFTEGEAGRRLQPILHDLGFLAEPHADDPAPTNLFASYLHMGTLPDGREPTEDEYDDMERFFDAELRAIGAHVLLPVGERATRHVLRHYTAKPADLADDLPAIHGTEIRGSGWLVIPIRDPREWESGDDDRLLAGLAALLEQDYRQEADLSRFVATDDRYVVR